jgi:succinate dehydrogenase / fumarate reductase, cytochrome b subunit
MSTKYELAPKKRPKHLDLVKIRLPLPGVISIMHRISGAALFLFLPLLLCLFQSSVTSEASYAQFQNALGNPLLKLLLIALLWGFLHHFCAGIRYLALDMHWGTELKTARSTSWAVLAVSIALTLILGARIW